MKICHSIQSQQNRLLEWLKEKPITTFEARLCLDIASPAPRVHELRHQFGLNIQTFSTNDINPGTKGLHKVARYVLLPGKYPNTKKQKP